MAIDTAYAAVRRAVYIEQPTVVDILTEAFTADPVTGWLFPDAAERARRQPEFYRRLLGHPAAETYLVGGHDGTSVWLKLAARQSPHADSPESVPAPGEAGARLAALGQALARHHPLDAPHLYLWCMGVVASRQGAGLGSALLRHRLAQADDEGLGAYLEASSPQSRALYLRHGFTDLAAPVQVGDGPKLWPLWRSPRAIHHP